jgi:hypothetical protein
MCLRGWIIYLKNFYIFLFPRRGYRRKGKQGKGRRRTRRMAWKGFGYVLREVHKNESGDWEEVGGMRWR